MTRLVLAPRWSGTAAHDWYPWLDGQLDDQLVVISPDDPDNPEVERWPKRIAEILSADPDALAETVLIGHSVGCQAILRAAAQLNGGVVPATLLVAGWWAVDEPWESILPWMEPPGPLGEIASRLGTVRVLISTDDPFTADYRSNAEHWRNRLGAEVEIVADARHFNQRHEPSVLAALRELLAAARSA
ncbi:MAG: alpha/beta hydrolase [Deltaproteobacteria bacterium]|nr:alpha/beta hydrolase [Deltaproteobacteria bacterium]